MKLKQNHADYILATIFFLLLVFGVLVLAGVSAVFSQAKTGRPEYFLLRHLAFGIAPGLVLGFIAYKINLSFFKKWAWLFFLLVLISMIFVFVPGIGIEAGGATRWINLGFASFQPSEFLKIAFILYIAAMLAKSPVSKKTKSNFLPFLIMVLFIGFLLGLQPDIGTLGVVAAVFLAMFFAANNPWWQVCFMILLIAVVFLGFVFYSPYGMDRVLLYLGIESDPMGKGFQIKQSEIIVGSGGVSGLGLGSSLERFGFVPQVIGDSIFSVIAEETGFIGSFFLILLFFLFLWRGIKIAENSSNHFACFAAVGISVWICLQAFINIGAMIGVIPLTGIPMPFISYGGSHIIAEIIAVSILLNISKNS